MKTCARRTALNRVVGLMSYPNQIVQVAVVEMAVADAGEVDRTNVNVSALKRIETKMEILSSRNTKNQRKW